MEPSEAVEKGQLRSDIFYRLDVMYLTIPPLRERKDDIDLLINHFIKHYNTKFKKNIRGVSEEVLKLFNNYSWPGNIRQLKHCIECAMNVVSSDDNVIEEFHIPKYLQINSPKNFEVDVEKINNNPQYILNEIKNREREKIIDALMRNKGNITKTANDLNMSRQSLQYRLKKYNIK